MEEQEKEENILQEAQEEQPVQPKKRILKVLTGPHKDAEIELGLEPLLLGKGESCDIVLMDNALLDVHASFVQEGDNIFCEPQGEAQVLLEGKAISERTELKDFQPILCGTTLLAVGPVDEVWPEIKSVPTSPQKDKEQVPQKTEEKKISQNTETKEKTSSPKEETTKTFNKTTKIIIGGLVLVLLMGFLGLLWIGLQPEPKEETQQFPIVTLKTAIETVLKQNNVNMEHVQINLSGTKFILQCYVKDFEEKKKLEKQLRAIPKIIFQSLRIYPQVSFVEQAQEILNVYGTLTAKPGAELDTISLQGYLYSIDTLPAIKNRLFKDITGLNNIETVLLSPDEIYDLASNLLTQYGLMGLLKIHTVKNGLMVTGNIQASDEPKWKDAQKALKKSLNNACKVLTYVAVVAPQAVKKVFFPSPITAVSIPENEAPWIDLKNGDRYFEGTLLPSSYKIKSITQEGIQIQKNEDTVFFTLTEL